MKYRIIYWEYINDDLSNIWDYIERMTFSKIESEKFVWELMSSVWILSIFPYLYQNIYKEFHFINIKNLRIIYFVNENKKEVIIYRILWQSQDYGKIL